MALMRWREQDIFKELADLQEEMNRVFNSLFKWPMRKEAKWSPSVDIYEDKDNLYVEAEIPGVDSKDIQLFLEGDTLTIKGKKEEKREVKEENFHRIERFQGEFQRKIVLPCEVDPDKIKASYKKGVLKVVLPKKEEAKGKEIKIEIEE